MSPSQEKRERGNDSDGVGSTNEEKTKQFVHLKQYNHKDRQESHYLLQWDGNEEALTLLHELIGVAAQYRDFADEISTYWMYLNKHAMLPSTVRQMSATGIVEFCEGTIESPPFSREHLQSDEILSDLNHWLSYGRLEELFVNDGNNEGDQDEDDEEED